MADAVHDAERLKELQALPLERKIQITQTRIIEWYQHYNGQVCVSFSGGKDSTVLLHIARQIYPDIPAVFSNTGLEYSSIQRFVKTWDNVDIVVPKMRFDEVISTYGYPLIGKEVAEAIYYARRLRSQTVQVERERVARFSTNAENSWGVGQPYLDKRSEKQKNNLARPLGREPANKRTELGGAEHTRAGKQTLWKRMEIGGADPQESGDQRCAHDGRTTQQEQTSRGSKWGAWYRRCLAPDEQDEGDRECFWNKRAGVVTGKSQFNKEKWLPLVYTPFMISHMCCHKMKKQPMHKYQKEHGYKPILATLAEESRVRKQGWIRHGCNAFDSNNPMSQPMSFWTEQDVLTYLVKYNVPIASVYGEIVHVGDDEEYYPPVDLTGHVMCNLKCSGCQRTGCAFCAFGMHLEKKGKTRFQILAEVEPRKYEYALGGGQWVDNPHYDSTAPKYDGDWLNWNPKKIWVPSKKGLGMGEVFRMVNEIYGKDFYRWE